MIIKLKQDGKKQQKIAQLIGCSQASVSKWIAKYGSGRTLETLPRTGRPTKLSNAKLRQMRSKLTKEVKKVNEQYCSLNTKQLANIIKKEVGREYSIRHVERIMHKLGFSLIMPRSQHIKHDQKKVDTFRDEFKKNFSRSIWVLSS